jgi:hypothetical protein
LADAQATDGSRGELLDVQRGRAEQTCGTWHLSERADLTHHEQDFRQAARGRCDQLQALHYPLHKGASGRFQELRIDSMKACRLTTRRRCQIENVPSPKIILPLDTM